MCSSARNGLSPENWGASGFCLIFITAFLFVVGGNQAFCFKNGYFKLKQTDDYKFIYALSMGQNRHWKMTMLSGQNICV